MRANTKAKCECERLTIAAAAATAGSCGWLDPVPAIISIVILWEPSGARLPMCCVSGAPAVEFVSSGMVSVRRPDEGVIKTTAMMRVLKIVEYTICRNILI